MELSKHAYHRYRSVDKRWRLFLKSLYAKPLPERFITDEGERSDTSKKRVEEHVSKEDRLAFEIPDEPSDAKLNRWRDDAVILDDLRDELKTHLEEKGRRSRGSTI